MILVNILTQYFLTLNSIWPTQSKMQDQKKQIYPVPIILENIHQFLSLRFATYFGKYSPISNPQVCVWCWRLATSLGFYGGNNSA